MFPIHTSRPEGILEWKLLQTIQRGSGAAESQTAATAPTIGQANIVDGEQVDQQLEEEVAPHQSLWIGTAILYTLSQGIRQHQSHQLVLVSRSNR